MRRHVFTAEDGRVPDLQFFAEKVECSGSEARSTCEVTGELVVRGTARPLVMELEVTRDGSNFRAAGDGVVRLSAYGIPQPAQLGVRTTNDVKIHVDFVVRPAPALVADAATGHTR
jgi:polyisoprenoid-binding protein YceI